MLTDAWRFTIDRQLSRTAGACTVASFRDLSRHIESSHAISGARADDAPRGEKAALTLEQVDVKCHDQWLVGYGPTHMRITTPGPEDNGRFVHALKEVLPNGQD